MDCLVGPERIKTEPFVSAERIRNPVFEYKFDRSQPFRGQVKRFHVLEDKTIKLTAHEYDPDAGLVGFQAREELPKRMSLVPDEYVNPHPISNAIFDVIQTLLKSSFSPRLSLIFSFAISRDLSTGQGVRL